MRGGRERAAVERGGRVVRREGKIGLGRERERATEGGAGERLR